MSVKVYTQEQILCGIRIFWKEELGCELPIYPDMRMDEQLEAEGFTEGLEIIEIICGLENLFGPICPLKEWHDFFGVSVKDAEQWKETVAPRLTFRGLAEFIGERLNPISLEPVNLLGRFCLTAGIFRGLEQLAVQVNPRVARFAPSTPIRQCLRGVSLHQFWSQLRWMVHDEIPPPPRIEVSFWGCLLSVVFKCAIGLLIALWRRDPTGLATGIGVTFALLIPSAWIVQFINSRLNPLLEGIETFGDLARVLAAIIRDQESECALCSMP